MRKFRFKVSECYYSLQGEGKYVGVPSVFLRLFGCNLQCDRFGVPDEDDKVTDDEDFNPERMGIDLSLRPDRSVRYKNIHSLPILKTGCDRYSSWDTRFEHLSVEYTDTVLSKRLVNLIPKKNWQVAEWNSVHLVITGGEPLLNWQQGLPDLLNHENMVDLRYCTIETNGTIPLEQPFKDYLNQQASKEFTFAISPKISSSGEDTNKTIQPEIVLDIEKHCRYSYLLFTVETHAHVEEVKRVMDQYREAGCTSPVYISPVGIGEQHKINTTRIANFCALNRFMYSPRLSTALWGNISGR